MIRNSTQGENTYTEHVSQRELITAIVKQFTCIVGESTAVNVARNVPQLFIDDDGNVLDYNEQDFLGTISLLIEQYKVLSGESEQFVTLQIGKPLANDPEDNFAWELVLSENTALPVQILLVDNNVLFREGVVTLLGTQPNMRIVGQTDSLQGALWLIRKTMPHMVLMSMNLPDNTGVNAIRTICTEFPEIKVLILAVDEDEEILFEAIRAGAIGYISKEMCGVEFIRTLKGITRGEADFIRAPAHRILGDFVRLTPRHLGENLTLTGREREILIELVNNASNKEIAKRLMISENTAKNHVRNVLTKLQVHSRSEAAEYARLHGLIGQHALH